MGLGRQRRRLSIMLWNLRLFLCNSPPTPSLLDLPNELLLLIAQNSHPKDILSLLLVNRRLLHLLTSTYDDLAIENLGILRWKHFPGLHWAAAKGHTKLVRLLLDRGTDVNTRITPHGTTALHYAAVKGHALVARLLLDRGATVDARDSIFQGRLLSLMQYPYANLHGMTPLHYAAATGSKAVIPLLLDAGADIEARDEVNWRTPLIVAAFHGRHTAVKVLLARGADIAAVDRYKWRAVMYALADGMQVYVNGPGIYWNRATDALIAAERMRPQRTEDLQVGFFFFGRG